MDKIGNLELTILELGAEVYRLKERISNMAQSHEDYRKTIESLKSMLEQKGVLTVDDIEMFGALSEINDEIDTCEESNFDNNTMVANKRELN